MVGWRRDKPRDEGEEAREGLPRFQFIERTQVQSKFLLSATFHPESESPQRIECTSECHRPVL
jgi:hypothetical protein